jgi:hypothetical protein
VAKKAPAKKAPAKKAPAKKAPQVLKTPKAPAKPIATKLQSTTKGNATTISVAPKEINTAEIVVEERRLTMLPPVRPSIALKKAAALKPLKGAPAPLVVSESEGAWTATELKSMRTQLQKELVRLRQELADAEKEMENSELKKSVQALRDVIQTEQIKKQQDIQAAKVAANEEIRQLKETIAVLQEQRSAYLKKSNSL